ncbi:PLP-dependent aminotransferase family protein [Luteimicrobium sp. NPDC057192]|uniref:MocR-like pyridoxine biosynthesis transcription factor PdxR n=1 Tax=Luteimicrobium sp. NPDC057192 TaxID=3346042 RepID=UPI003640B2A3
MAGSQTNPPSSGGPRPTTSLAWETLLDLSPARPGPGGTATVAKPGPSSDAPPQAPLHRRLAEALRGTVRDGRVPAGAALPPSRELAATLGVSRWTVTEAYGELVAEGVLEARTGSGTRVAGALAPAREAGTTASGARTAGRSGTRALTGWPAPPRRRFDLAAGVPDLRHVPRTAWVRAVRESLADAPDVALGAADPAGVPELRRLLAGHLDRARLVRGDADDLVVTHGAADGLARLAGALRAAGHVAVAVEDPGWVRLHDVLRAAGLEPVPVAVDEDGLDVDRLASLRAEGAPVRAVLLTPAHQFPTGVALSPARRERVVAWARDVDGLVVEDDYDAEFRYDRRAVGALQGLDPDRVALLGSLSKTVSPALGMGWLVVPPAWRDRLAPVTSAPSTVDQLALARLLASGAYERHLRAARGRYRRRRAALLDALATHLPELPVSGLAAGMHVLLGLPAGVRADDVAAAAAERDVTVAPVSRYRAAGVTSSGNRAPRCPEDHVGQLEPEALVVGYGNLADARVDEAVVRLAAVVCRG